MDNLPNNLQGGSFWLFLGLIIFSSLLIHGFLILCLPALRQEWAWEITVHLLIFLGLFWRLWDSLRADTEVVCCIALLGAFSSYTVPKIWGWLAISAKIRQWLQRPKSKPFNDDLLDN